MKSKGCAKGLEDADGKGFPYLERFLLRSQRLKRSTGRTLGPTDVPFRRCPLSSGTVGMSGMSGMNGRRRRWRRRSVRAAACAAFALACGSEPDAPGVAVTDDGASAPEAAARLNVLLITIDTLRADALGAYDTSRRNSPNIDRLAAEGVRFEQAVTSAPSTLPSHSTIMTGKQPYAHGVRSNNGYVLAAANVTLAERLRDAGYTTAAEVAAPVIARRTQIGQGFDRFTDTGSFEARLKRVSIKQEHPLGVPRARRARGLRHLAARDRIPGRRWRRAVLPVAPLLRPPCSLRGASGFREASFPRAPTTPRWPTPTPRWGA